MFSGVIARLVLVLALVLACAAVVVTASAQEYTIGSGDVLKITVWGHEDLSKEYPVNRDGFVPFPLVGQVKAKGMTTTQFARRLGELLEKDYLVNPQVMVAVKEYLSRKVQVLGEAAKPGLIYLTGPTKLVELLSQMGGVAPNAGKDVLLIRPDGHAGGIGTVLRFDLRKVLAGDITENTYVEADDVILVPKAQATFFVFGEVKKPGAYQLDKETNVLEGITIAGGLTDKAAPGRTRVLRTTSKGQEILYVDVNDILRRGQSDKTFRLAENDVIVVPESFF
jgi:polysaccharide biosynthesis/export protein